eukprot:9502611-Pyramimonas_sp.AAC.1
MEHWQSSLNPDASHDTVVDEENGGQLFPLIELNGLGHSCFAQSIERMHAPCEFGLARCHGHLLRVTSLETIKESTLGSGAIKYPNKLSGLRRAPDYGLLRLMPTSQRKDGDAPLAKVYQAAGAAPAGGGPPTRGTWPRA